MSADAARLIAQGREIEKLLIDKEFLHGAAGVVRALTDALREQASPDAALIEALENAARNVYRIRGHSGAFRNVWAGLGDALDALAAARAGETT